MDGVRRNLLNDVLWPDFTRIPSSAFPTLLYREVPEDGPFELAGFTITAIRVNHTVECAAYFIQGRAGTLLHVGDTGPTDAVWRHAHMVHRLLAVCVETTFPNRLQEIAEASGHLTPQDLDKELEKLDRDVPVFVYHLKPHFRSEILAELKRLRRRALHILEDGTLYRF
jgi:mRNA degradation ribonuclease J1/J2